MASGNPRMTQCSSGVKTISHFGSILSFNFHLVDTRLEAVSRFSFTVLKKLILIDKKTFIVTECVVRIEGNIEGGEGQGVLADQEVLVIVDVDGVLHRVAQ